MKTLVMFINAMKAASYAFFLVIEIFAIIQDNPYRFHYLLILSVFLPFLVLTGVLETVFFIKNKQPIQALIWIIPTLLIAMSIQGDDTITSYLVTASCCIGCLVSGYLFFLLKKQY